LTLLIKYEEKSSKARKNLPKILEGLLIYFHIFQIIILYTTYNTFDRLFNTPFLWGTRITAFFAACKCQRIYATIQSMSKLLYFSKIFIYCKISCNIVFFAEKKTPCKIAKCLELL